MTTLFDLQNSFIQALINDDCISGLAAHIHENNLTAKQRIQIYRNNYMITLTGALKNIFPVILRLVGENFFNATVKEFVDKKFHTNGNLNEFGESFPTFLVNFIPAKALPYLPAVADFEWVCHTAYYAMDYLPLDLSRLKAISKEKYGLIKFKLHPSHRLLEYQFPILDIWQMCQGSTAPESTIDLSAGEQKLLVIRSGLTVHMLQLSTGEFALLSAFSRESEFAEACLLALAAEPEFQIDQCLQKHLLHQHIVDFSFDVSHNM